MNYKMGAKIKNLDELMKQDMVYWNERLIAVSLLGNKAIKFINEKLLLGEFKKANKIDEKEVSK